MSRIVCHAKTPYDRFLAARHAALCAQSSPCPTSPRRKPRRSRSYLSPGYPVEIASAQAAERIAWIAYEEGKRNVYTAAAPAFSPVRLTSFMKDDGVDMTTVRISADGSVVVFVRGHAPNRDGWVANPSSNPDGADRTIWAARTATPGVAWKLAEGAAPELAPDGSAVIFRARRPDLSRDDVPGAKPADPTRSRRSAVHHGLGHEQRAALVAGRQVHLVRQPADRSQLHRHLRRREARTLKYMSPGVDFDSSPTWSAGQQAHRVHPSAGSRVRSAGAAGQRRKSGQSERARVSAAANAARGGGQGGGGGRQGGRGAGRARWRALQAARRKRTGRHHDRAGSRPTRVDVPWRLHAFDVGRRSRHRRSIGVLAHDAGRAVFTSINSIQWAGDHVIFSVTRPGDEWDRWFSLPIAGPSTAAPTLLTTTDGIIEDATSLQLSKDGKTLYYTTNHGDIDRRHIWAVPTAGGQPRQVSKGAGIETYPMPLASGQRIAAFYADARRPQSVSVIQTATGEQKVIYPALPASFPMAAHVDPTAVTLKAADGFEFYNQLFVPKDIKPGEKRPAMVFVHGGPVRQMLLGYHYRHFYHMAYAVNQWLGSQGYIVMSVNFRSGVGYGRSFRSRRAPAAPATAIRRRARGRQVPARAAGRRHEARRHLGTLLRRRAHRAGARAQLRSVRRRHRPGRRSSLGQLAGSGGVSYQSSAISAIDKWKSPVLLIHGDDDRNVAFQQTTGLVQLLRQRDVDYELIVFPDDVHDSLMHSRWMYTFERMDQVPEEASDGQLIETSDSRSHGGHGRRVTRRTRKVHKLGDPAYPAIPCWPPCQLFAPCTPCEPLIA